MAVNCCESPSLPHLYSAQPESYVVDLSPPSGFLREGEGKRSLGKRLQSLLNSSVNVMLCSSPLHDCQAKGKQIARNGIISNSRASLQKLTFLLSNRN